MNDANNESLIRRLSLPLTQSRMWMKLVGVLMIVYGVFAALSIVGLLIAWLPIWTGVLLFQTANAAEEAQLTGDEEPMLRALGKLRVYFTIVGVLTLISLIPFVLGLLGALFGGMSGMPGLHHPI